MAAPTASGPPSVRAPRPELEAAARLTPRFWLLLVATGIAAGLAAGALMSLLHTVQHLAWNYRQGGFFDAVARAPARRVVLVLLAAGVLIGLTRRFLRLHVGGHGGEVTAAVWLHDGRLDPAPTLIRAVLSIIGVGMGVALGREGAPKQVGGVAANLFADWSGLDAPQRRLLVACGAGAGMAAVYDVPFGGALYTAEVLLGTLSLTLMLPALAASGIATATSWLLLPHVVTYDFGFPTLPSPRLLAFALLAGPLIGLAAVVHVRAIAWADGKHPRGWRELAAPLLVLGVLGVVALRFPQVLGNGKDVVTQTLTESLPLAALATLLPLRLLATTACLAAGAPGGLFTPTLALGALLGGLLGALCNLALPPFPVGVPSLIGTAAFLAAATHGPLSALALMLELTRRIDPQAVPLLLAVAGATLTARLLEPRSIYTARLPH